MEKLGEFGASKKLKAWHELYFRQLKGGRFVGKNSKMIRCIRGTKFLTRGEFEGDR